MSNNKNRILSQIDIKINYAILAALIRQILGF